MTILIKNGNIVSGKKTQKGDLLIEDGKILKVNFKANDIEDRATGKANNSTDNSRRVIDANGLTIVAGFVDMHCHLREPGFEYKEDIKSGSTAAVKGGFTTVCCMPNTKPVNDNAVVTKYIVQRAKEVNLTRVLPIGSISKNQKGEELSEILSMKEQGIIAVSDDGQPVVSSNLYKMCLEYIKPFGILAISHCEDKSLSSGGVVNEGLHSTMCGLKGQIKACEEVMVARDIIIAENLGCKIHIAHISTKGSVEIIRQAKKRGVKVTCETCPHYIAGDDSMILSYNTNTKVNPPLREKQDVEAIIDGLKDGTIDCIATDHAPHHADDKNIEYDLAAFGISGFETAFALCYTELVLNGHISFEKLMALMSENPSNILGLDYGVIAEGKTADITILDLNEKYKIDKNTFVSKGKNTPFDRREVVGKVKYTIVGGEIKYGDR